MSPEILFSNVTLKDKSTSVCQQNRSLSCMCVVCPYFLQVTEKAMGTLLANTTTHQKLYSALNIEVKAQNFKRQETAKDVCESINRVE